MKTFSSGLFFIKKNINVHRAIIEKISGKQRSHVIISSCLNINWKWLA